MFNEIRSSDDIKLFLDKTNMLHDGYILDAKYEYHGIEKIENELWFCPGQDKVTIKIVATSIFDAIVEIEFDKVSEWQINSRNTEIFAAYVDFIEPDRIIWAGEFNEDMDEMKKNSYVIAQSMKWRILGEFRI
ncbi:MAG: hypothetical protein E7634_06380 [Ruminococcaceae bacterium]|nr:hypothetical protein [Oscillospiraceae bacterium]